MKYDELMQDEIIEKCLEAVRLAPSTCNNISRGVLLWSRLLSFLSDSIGILPELPMRCLKGVLVIIVICAKTEFITNKLAKRISKVDYSTIGIGIAGKHLVIAEESFGLGSC